MKNAVMIKGNRYGISIILNNEIPFDELIKELIMKLSSADEFFDCDKQLAVSFEGRILSNEELDTILSTIEQYTKLKISYIVDNNSDLETTFYNIIKSEQNRDEKEEAETTPLKNGNEATYEYNNVTDDKSSGLFYRGTLKAGQIFETPESVIVIGDVNKDAAIVAGGNIVVIGHLKGIAKAGRRGDVNSFVMALSMEPQSIEINGILASEHSLKKATKNKRESMIAILIDKQISIDPISKSAINDFYF